jgi:hypothetical protein
MSLVNQLCTHINYNIHLNNNYKTAHICVRLWGGDLNAVDFRVSKQVLQIEQQKTTSDKMLREPHYAN